MVVLHSVTLAAILAAVLVLPVGAQECLAAEDGTPLPEGTQPVQDRSGCLPAPPTSVQVNPHPMTGDGITHDVDSPGVLMPVEAALHMPVPRAEVEPLDGAPSSDSAPSFPSLSVPMRYQDSGDASCGVQALGMALSSGPGSPPTSAALLGFLQGHGMMYEFGTGVEELAYAAQAFGYKGAVPFHGGDLTTLQSELATNRPVVVALGANGEGQPGHFVTVTGISSDGRWISYNDPTLGEQVVPTSAFLQLWELQGNSGVSIAREVPPVAPDPTPWVALAAGIMALVSTSPLSQRRQGIGGRIIAGTSSSSKSASPKPASIPSAKLRGPSEPSPKPVAKPAASAPKAVVREEAAFQASPPAPPPVPIPRGVTRAEEAFVPPVTPRPLVSLGSEPVTPAPPTQRTTVTPTPPGQPTPTPTPVVTRTPQPPSADMPSPTHQEPQTTFAGPVIMGFPALPGGSQVSLEDGTFVGNNPFSVSPSYGPGADIPGIPGLILRAISLINTFLRPYAYGDYLNSHEPNVSARLSYSQSPEGTLLQSVIVENHSSQALKINVDVVGSGGTAYSSSPEWVLGEAAALYSGTDDSGADPTSGLALLARNESAKVWIGIVASFNDPPLLRSIEFVVPSSEGVADAQQPH